MKIRCFGLIIVFGCCLFIVTGLAQSDVNNEQKVEIREYLNHFLVDNLSQMNVVPVETAEAKDLAETFYGREGVEIEDWILFEAIPEAPLHMKAFFMRKYLQFSLANRFKSDSSKINGLQVRIGEPVRVHSPIRVEEEFAKALRPIAEDAVEKEWFAFSIRDFEAEIIMFQSAIQQALGDYYIIPIYLGETLVMIANTKSYNAATENGESLSNGSSSSTIYPSSNMMRHGFQKDNFPTDCTFVDFDGPIGYGEIFCLSEDLIAESTVDGHKIRLTNVSEVSIDERQLRASLLLKPIDNQVIGPTIKEKSIRASFGLFPEEEVADYIEFMSSKHSDRSYVNTNIEYEVLK